LPGAPEGNLGFDRFGEGGGEGFGLAPTQKLEGWLEVSKGGGSKLLPVFPSKKRGGSAAGKDRHREGGTAGGSREEGPAKPGAGIRPWPLLLRIYPLYRTQGNGGEQQPP